MYPKLLNWIQEAKDTVGTTLTPFTYIGGSRRFLDGLAEIAKEHRDNWTAYDRRNIRLFREIRRGEAVPVKGYSEYVINKKGQIYKLGLPKSLKLTSTQTVKGYEVINLNNGKQKTFLMHRLVAENFIVNPDPEKLQDVHHIDGNRRHNSTDNLMWTSHAANIRLRDNTQPIPEDAWVDYDDYKTRVCAYCGELAPA